MRLASLKRLERLGTSKRRSVRWVARAIFSVQTRTTLAAVFVVGFSLMAAFGAVALILRSDLTQNIVNTAKNEAYDIVSLVKDGQLPNPLPLPRGDLAAQVVSNTGKVISYTPNLKGVAALKNPGSVPPGGTVEMRVTRRANRISINNSEVDDRTVFVAIPVQVPNGLFPAVGSKATQAVGTSTLYVYTIASLSSVDQSVHTLVEVFIAFYPLLIVVVALSTWILSRRAFAPVEQIRHDVDEITGSNLSNRVFQPTGTDEIARLAKTMNEMLARLEASVLRQKQFIADASHELKSPLSALRASLEIALLHSDSTNWTETGSIALSESDRMQHLIEDLLLLAKTESGIKFKTEVVDLDELAREEVRRIRRAGGGVVIDLSRLASARVVGDLEQVRSVVRNLAENAVRYARSRVLIATETTKDGCRLVVSDDGPGIPPGERTEVFERFSRLDASRSRQQGGSGLGLAIVKSVVAAMGGSIFIRDGELGGAEFVVVWPESTAKPPPTRRRRKKESV